MTDFQIRRNDFQTLRNENQAWRNKLQIQEFDGLIRVAIEAAALG